MKIDIRPESKSDCSAIHRINVAAFGGNNNEALLVDELRHSARFQPGLSLVARHYEQMAGHILFLPADIVNGERKTEILVLASLSVLPACRKQGVGSKLVKVGLSKAKKLGFSAVAVFGAPAFYQQLGFAPAAGWGLRASLEIPGVDFLALELVPGALRDAAGTVKYPKAFNRV